MGRATRWIKGLFGIKSSKEISNSDDKQNSGAGDQSRRHSSRRLCHNPGTIPPNISTAEAAWLSSYNYNETEKEQNKHAIAVAAATAAAADAAVAAAQAAVVVVRLTSKGRGGTMFGGGGWAAVRIQTVFRGYLARKALRALKGLVKLQAVVRGYLVRKQATATFHSMQALIRAQASVRSQRMRGLVKKDNKFETGTTRNSMERFDEVKSKHSASIHSRRLPASLGATITGVDESPKIVEIDTGRPKSRSRRTNTSMSDFGDDPLIYPTTMSSPLALTRIPTRLSIPDPDWGLTGDECRFSSTAHSTPRFATTSSGGSHVAPATPAKSVCADNFFRNYGDFPNYMANTKSFKAKLRSHSAPKQRPEPGPKKRLSLHEMMGSRYSLSGVRMQRSCSQVQEAISFKNAVMGKLDRLSTTTTGCGDQRNYFPRKC